MSAPAATCVVLLTPVGRGAVASLLVEGPEATTAVRARFFAASGQPLEAQPCERIVYGRWGSAETGEEVVVCRRDPQRVEIHCHGGHAAAAAIVRSLVERGCQETTWQEWVRESESSRIVGAARIQLAAAPTERSAAILWDQCRGALDRARAQIAAEIAAGNTPSALASIEALLMRSGVGLHLTTPWQVVFSGRPNVGKSSLINALVGYRRGIVHDLPGTTRDVVTTDTALDGWPVELADTAGIRSTDESLEAAGIQLAQGRMATADLVVLVFDARDRRTSDDDALCEAWPAALRVYNKCDLVEPGVLADIGAGTLATSAVERIGIDLLASEIVRRLVPKPPALGDAVPFMPEQVELLAQVRAALQEDDGPRALRLLAGE